MKIDRCSFRDDAKAPSPVALRVLDLFSGIGGFSLGLERTGGFKTVAFCEIEEFPRRVLAKHWPGVPIHRDVRELRGSDLGPVDVICGGFPCQDISLAGEGAGIHGARSGLWREYARLIGEIRPHYVIVENVAALLGRGLGTVLGDLATLGYDAEWRPVFGTDCGLPQVGQRIWIVATPQRAGREGCFQYVGALGFEATPPTERRNQAVRARGALDAHFIGLRSIDGLSVEMERRRIRGLGNAVYPQVAEMIGRAILAAEGLAAEAEQGFPLPSAKEQP